MKIADIVGKKGGAVVTIAPDASVADLVAMLGSNNIGAVIVSPDGESIAGIVSERDVVRRLAAEGPEVLGRPVSEIMTADVTTCQPEDTLEDTAHTMTYRRIRHLPVVAEGRLAAIISIGDVVKYRIDQLQDERNHLLGYLHA